MYFNEGGTERERGVAEIKVSHQLGWNRRRLLVVFNAVHICIYVYPETGLCS